TQRVARERRAPGLAGRRAGREGLRVEPAPVGVATDRHADQVVVAVEVVDRVVARAGAPSYAITGGVVAALDDVAVAALLEHTAERVTDEGDFGRVVLRAHQAAEGVVRVLVGLARGDGVAEHGLARHDLSDDAPQRIALDLRPLLLRVDHLPAP